LTACAKFSRTEKKVKSKATTKASTKNSGDGSWSSGFNCPEIKVGAGSAEQKVEASGKFYAERVISPITAEEKLGWVWELKAKAAGNLAKICVAFGSGNSCYIPYRWVTSDFSYTNPSGDYKYLQGWITNDSNESYHLRINLPYSTLSYYISDDEGRRIANGIATNRTSNQGTILTKKTSATTNASNYATKKPLYDASIASGSNIDAAKQAANTKLTALGESIKTQQALQQTALTEYNTLNSSAQESANKLKTITSTLNSLASQLEANQKTLQSLGTSTTANDDQLLVLKTQVDNSLSAFNNEVDVLKADVPQHSTDINSAVTANTNLNTAGVQSELGKFTPF